LLRLSWLLSRRAAVAVDDDSVSGVVVNKPLDIELGAAIPDGMSAAVGPTLSSYPLYRGGDVSERQLLLLHNLDGLAESSTIVPGLHATSSFTQVRDALAEHSARAAVHDALRREGAVGDETRGGDERGGGSGGSGGGGGGGGGGSEGARPATSLRPRVKCVAGFAGWAREQLRAELDRNVWFLAEADDVAALAMMEPAAGASDGASWLRDAMWSGAMTQLGGEHEQLARFPGEHEVVWAHMEQLWTRQSEELHRRIDLLGEPKGRDSS
jgi:putative AlgH/UPF0301 family transcriptional regulator